MIDWADLETPLTQTPRFYVEAPDKRKDWSEIDRQAALFAAMHRMAPRVLGYAIPNAGKRNPRNARKEGIMAGVFDTRWEWRAPLTAVIEMKGYDARGRAGTLSAAQIDYGNRMHDLGHQAACFFDPLAAVSWLREIGFPVAGSIAA